MLQAEGIKIGAEHFRRSMPETMGSIFWQLNDCWPVASWSSIDYYGRWKALQYYARRFYAPMLVSPHVEDGSVKVYIVSDKTAAQPATLRVRLMDFDGKVLLEEKQDVSVAPLTSKVYLEWPFLKLTQAGAADTVACFRGGGVDRCGGTQISRNLTYLVAGERSSSQAGHPEGGDAAGTDGKTHIRVSSPVLARSVYLSFENLDVKVSDNYFDMLPGETVDIGLDSKASVDEVKAQLQVMSLTDAFAVTPDTATLGAAAQ